MNLSIFQAVIMGLTQGLAEFLPISSSGHLLLVQKLLGIPSTGLLLEVLLHVGTLVAVFVVYFKLFWNMLRHPIRSLLPELIVATIPAVIATLLLGDFFGAAFEGKFLGFSFLITSVVLVLSDVISKRVVTHDRLTWKDTIIMGLMQAFAILPGVSRSGIYHRGRRILWPQAQKGGRLFVYDERARDTGFARHVAKGSAYRRKRGGSGEHKLGEHACRNAGRGGVGLPGDKVHAENHSPLPDALFCDLHRNPWNLCAA